MKQNNNIYDMKQSTFLNTLNWYCVKCTCFGIFYFGSTSSNASKVVRSAYTAMHIQSCFVIFRFMMRRQSPIAIVLFYSFSLDFICCLHLLGYDKTDMLAGGNVRLKHQQFAHVLAWA